MNRSPRRLSSADEMRVLEGLAVQPFLAGGLAFVLFPLLLLDSQGQTLAGGYPSSVSDAALSVAVGTGIVAAAVTLIGVFPTAVWLLKRRDLTIGQTLLLGLGFGNASYVLMAAASGGTYGFEGFLRGVGFSSLLGLSGAAVFWIIALRPQNLRPDATAG